MSMFPEPDCIWDLKAGLGEGPIWFEPEQAVYFVDIVGRSVHRFHPESGARASWPAPERVSFIVPVREGGFLCGFTDGLRRFDPEAGGFGALHPIEPLMQANRLNDAAVDSAGRLWFGTMHDPEQEATGSLYRLDGLAPHPEPALMDTGYTVSNGPAIDPLRRRLYHNDSAARRIFVFDLDEAGTLSNKRLFAMPEQGHPDGLALDAEGTLWVALYGGGGVQRYRPDGVPDGLVTLPCRQVTKLAFGGPGLQTAYVTTARQGLTGPELADEPLAGGLFRFRVDVPGVRQPAFRVGQ